MTRVMRMMQAPTRTKGAKHLTRGSASVYTLHLLREVPSHGTIIDLAVLDS